MSEQNKVAAVVVTYNRKNLLRECLNALLAQTRPLDEIIVVDNASTDGTDQMIKEEFSQVTYLRLPENIGGAGGFHEGMKLAYEKEYDWIWVMDDDTIPMPDALDLLLQAANSIAKEIGVLCSHVVFTDGRPHIMNVPQISSLIKSTNHHIHPFNEYIDKGLLRIFACSFVSVLVSRHALQEVGLPIKEMFLYGDDIEFTERVCGRFPCYYVMNSKVVHKTQRNVGVDIRLAQPEQIWRYFFEVRNKTYLNRRRGAIAMLKYCLFEWPRCFSMAVRRRDAKIGAVMACVKGLIAGFFFNPRIVRL